MGRPCNEFWPADVPATLEPPAGSLFANLEARAKCSPDKPALHFMGRTYSYWSVLTQAERLAARLCELGVEPGDRVLVNMQNCPQLIIAHFAVFRANAVVVPVTR
jgi:fatty-acyl-CoA synthase